MFLYILLAIAVAAILAQAWLLYKFVNHITDLSDRCDKAISDYEALDQGFTELTDAYESDSLQYEDTIESLGVELSRYRENNSTLIHNATIDRTARHEQAATIDGLRRQLDVAQRIISEHDLNCLPHIVLSHMEKDTPLPL